MSEFINHLIERGIWTFPYLCIWGVALGVCINLQDRNKLATNFAITAFLIFIVTIIITTLAQTWLISFRDEAMSAVSIGTAFTILGVISTSLNLIGWLFLLFALYQLLTASPSDVKPT